MDFGDHRGCTWLFDKPRAERLNTELIATLLLGHKSLRTVVLSDWLSALSLGSKVLQAMSHKVHLNW